MHEGRYPGFIGQDHPAHAHIRLVNSWRRQIEADPEHLSHIARRYFSIEDSVQFQFIYAGEDTASRRTVIRYFAYAPRPFIIAGWQIQFVFDPAHRQLVGVFTEEVPLE